MSPTLRVILDDLGASSRDLSRYSEQLTRALVTTAPAGIAVRAFLPSSSSDQRDRVATLLPGIQDLRQSPLPERELRRAWLHSVTTAPMHGLVHGTSLLAPLRPIDPEDGSFDQAAATLQSLSPLTDPTVPKRESRWFAAALRRASRHADALVVPTHAIAAEVAQLHDFGDRIRVIGGGVSDALVLPVDADARATRLGLPERFVLAWTSTTSAAAARSIVATVAHGAMGDVPVVVVGPVSWHGVSIAELAVEAGLAPSRLLTLGELDDADLAVAGSRASVGLFVDETDGFALGMLEALSLGLPVVHPGSPSLLAVADDATLPVDATAGPQALAERVAAALEDEAMRERVSLVALDRAHAFRWPTTAMQVWQLHADL